MGTLSANKRELGSVGPQTSMTKDKSKWSTQNEKETSTVRDPCHPLTDRKFINI